MGFRLGEDRGCAETLWNISRGNDANPPLLGTYVADTEGGVGTVSHVIITDMVCQMLLDPFWRGIH